jgi:hypothetical protein
MGNENRSVDVKGDVREGVIISGDGNFININTDKQKRQSFGKNHNDSAENRAETSGKKPLIFLCHAKEDSDAVRNLYNRLKKDGFNPWMDEADILPGQNWDYEIKKAIKRTDFVLICLSNLSVRKRGYLNKEILWALNRQDEMLLGDIFMIPVKLEKCELPDRLSEHQSVDIFDPDGFEKLFQALRHQLGQKGLKEENTETEPKTFEPVKMNFAQKSKLAEALLACPIMTNRESRDAVVNELRDEIRNGIQRNNVTNIDVMNILNRCLDFSGGIKELMMIVRTFEGNSNGMQKVEEALKYAGISE